MDIMEYIRRIIKDNPLLSTEEEINLIIEAQKGNKEAEAKLVYSNIRLVIDTANKQLTEELRKKGIRKEDLISEGIFGLMKAIKKFDPTRGYRLSTFAVHAIKGAIQKYLQETPTIKISEHAHKQKQKIKKAEEELRKKLKREPTINELVKELNKNKKENFTPEKIIEYKNPYIAETSFNEPETSKDGESQELGDSIEDEYESPPEESTIPFLNKERAEAMLRELTSREKIVFEMRFGLREGQEPSTLVQIAKVLGISRERVHQIEAIVMKKMQNVLLSSGSKKSENEQKSATSVKKHLINPKSSSPKENKNNRPK